MDSQLVAALAAATIVQACWPWRPNVSVIGPSKGGKTLLLKRILQPLLGPKSITSDHPTEAAVRQAIGIDSMAILIDEFEDCPHRSKILELMRTSSRGGEVLRGSSDHQVRRFVVRHIFWVFSIESGDFLWQDRNRQIHLELNKPGKIQLPCEKEIQNLRINLAAAALWALPAAIQLSARLRSETIDNVDSRIVESYSVPVAMMAVLLHGREVDYDTAITLLRTVLCERDVEQAELDNSESQLLRDILYSPAELTVPGENLKEKIMIGQALEYPGCREELMGYGIKLISDRATKEKRLFIATELVRSRILKGTTWSQLRIDQVLGRILGAKTDQQRIGVLRPYGISLPWPGCLEIVNGIESESIEPGTDATDEVQ